MTIIKTMIYNQWPEPTLVKSARIAQQHVSYKEALEGFNWQCKECNENKIN